MLENENKESSGVSLENQERLAEILTDSPHLVSLNGTPFEIKALRMGTQWLISKKCVEIAKAESKTFGDIIKQFSINIPAIIEVLTLALLNDKQKIFKDGKVGGEYSDLYKATYDTLLWDCKTDTFGAILFETLQLIDTSFFMESCRILQILRESTTAKKTILERK